MAFMTTLSAEDQAFAEKYLCEVSSTQKATITKLKDSISLEPGLRANTDDAFLVRFLRARKYDTGRALILLRNYYSAHNDHILKDLLPSKLSVPIKEAICFPTDGYNAKDRTKIVVFRPGKWKLCEEQFEFKEMSRAMFLVLEHILRDEVVQVYGMRLVVDGSGVGWDHVKELTKGWPGIILRIIQDAMPLRLRGIHYINEPPMMGYIFALVKTFLKEKMLQWVHFHAANLDDMHTFISPQALPEHLGGVQPQLPNTEFIRKIIQSEDYFKEMSNYYLDDPKALFKLQEQDAKDSGVSGTYKKLNVE